jgi:TonB-dependent receptor
MQHARRNTDARARQFAPVGGVLIPAEMLTSYAVEAFSVPRVLTGDFAALAETVYGGFSDPGNSEVLEDRWQVEEDVIAAYLKFDFAGDAFGVPMEGNIGARVVDVDTSSLGFESVGGGPFEWITVDHDYTEVLPSLNLNFFASDELIIRVGLARAMARPPLDELRAGRFRDDPAVTPPPLTAFGGNPTLDPFLAWQVDLSTEWYFNDEALFAVSLYYKDVDLHIGYSTVPITIDGDLYALSGPANGDGGHIQGAEITFQTPFSFIPALQNFGIYSNYAYVDFIYWEPAWVSIDCETRWGKGSHWENSTFFDYESTSAHSGFDFLSYPYRSAGGNLGRIAVGPSRDAGFVGAIEQHLGFEDQ